MKYEDFLNRRIAAHMRHAHSLHELNKKNPSKYLNEQIREEYRAAINYKMSLRFLQKNGGSMPSRMGSSQTTTAVSAPSTTAGQSAQTC